jgi:hypothetical protein
VGLVAGSAEGWAKSGMGDFFTPHAGISTSKAKIKITI